MVVVIVVVVVGHVVYLCKNERKKKTEKKMKIEWQLSNSKKKKKQIKLSFFTKLQFLNGKNLKRKFSCEKKPTTVEVWNEIHPIENIEKKTKP